MALTTLASLGSTFWATEEAIAQTSPIFKDVNINSEIELETIEEIAQNQPIFENVTISPGLNQEIITIRGISGGPRAASKVAGRLETDTGPCVGFVDEKPDHTLTLTDFFNFLSLKVESSGDTTIVVQGPGGSWCNDDATGSNPGISGQWLEGVYKIWIGSYKGQSDAEVQYHPYVLYISE